MSASAHTLPIGGRTNWSRWAAAMAVALAAAIATALVITAVRGPGRAVPAPRPAPSFQIAPTSPEFVPAGDTTAGGRAYYAHRLATQRSADRPGWSTGVIWEGTAPATVRPALHPCTRCR